MKNSLKYIFICLFLSCAVKGPPTGGPLDLEGPYIIYTMPDNGEVSISKNESIQIYFNEMIDPNSVKSSISIIPEIDNVINSYGKRILIKPKKEWPENREIKIKVKRSIADYKGNTMSAPTTLTFSTSTDISNGIISGQVFNVDSLLHCTIGLYELKNDSLTLYTSIESDNKNNFKFNNIKNGEYIIIALSNQIRDIYSDYRRYPYSLFNEKVLIDDIKNNYNDINIYIESSNKNERMLSINMINNSYGEIILTDDSKLFLVDATYYKDKYKDLSTYNFFNNSLDSINYFYTINNNIEFYDIKGTYQLTEEIIDTISPEITNSYIENQKHFIEFSEPVIINDLPFYYSDSSGDSINFNYSIVDPKLIYINNLDYESINIDKALISDFESNLLINDSVEVDRSYAYLNGIGNIYGEVVYNGDHNILVELINIKSGKIKRVKTDKINSFEFKDILPDRYKIWAYEYTNEVTESYFNGTLYPLKLSSKFGIYNQIIEIRKNWDIEGIKITIMDNK